jgi:nucleoside-diphosphate-sugar epimerase
VRALVTGGAGFIGSHLALELLARGHQVVAVDALTASYDPSAKRARAGAVAEAGAIFHEEDLRTADLAPFVGGSDVVFHLAGQPGVRDSWGSGFNAYVEHNVAATQRLLDAAVGAGLHRFVFASSSSVYGEALRHPTPEHAGLAPVSPYGVTKAAAEMLVAAYAGSFGLPSVTLRYFTVYGPGQRPDMAFHRFIRAILDGRPLEVFGDGEQSRDVTFVADAVEATIAAAEAEGVEGRTINVGGGSVITLNECLRTLSRVAGREVEIIYTEPQPGDARHTSADLRRAKELLAYAPAVSLEEGLRAQWEWLAGSP